MRSIYYYHKIKIKITAKENEHKEILYKVTLNSIFWFNSWNLSIGSFTACSDLKKLQFLTITMKCSA
jgi:hypothetical protein